MWNRSLSASAMLGRFRATGMTGAVLLVFLSGPKCSSDASGGSDADALGGDARVTIKTVDGGDQDLPDVVGGEDFLDLFDAGGEGEVVNGFDYPCDPMTTQSCVTACGSAGQQKCLKEWGPCVPPGEFCGNCLDDDCDGLVNESCPIRSECLPPIDPGCPVAKITIAEEAPVYTQTTLHLSAEDSYSDDGEIVQWAWSVEAPAGNGSDFVPGSDVEKPTFEVVVAGLYLFSLEVWDEVGNAGCSAAQVAVNVAPYPPLDPEVGCSDGEREGFVEMESYPHVAGCSGSWSEPGIDPDTVVSTCNLQAGDDGVKPDGQGCSTPDLCAAGWHVCVGWQELAAKSETGCAGATPPDAKPKSLFFALRQPSETGSVCGDWGDGYNDVFGCGNLGAGLGPDKGCGPLDRVLASTQPNTCGFNEAEPPLGPWECKGGQESHLMEGALVTKKACQGNSCSYDGYPIGAWDKGGVLCCRD